MPLSMYSASVAQFAQMLTNMLTWFDKAEAYAEAKKFDTGVYLTMRLAPDMLPLKNQVQIASDMVKGCVARLAGQDVPAWEDNEATLDDLRARIRKTIDFIQSVPAAAVDGSDAREIALPTRTGEPRRFTGETYLKHFVLPNFYFHLSAAYAVARNFGADVGKRDFLGAIPIKRI